MFSPMAVNPLICPTSLIFHLPTPQDLSDHSGLVTYQHIPDIHRAAINRVLFEPEAELIMTSSESEDTSVVVMHASLRRDPYIWKVAQVLRCGVPGG